jgi:hypothetical protein
MPLYAPAPNPQRDAITQALMNVANPPPRTAPPQMPQQAGSPFPQLPQMPPLAPGTPGLPPQSMTPMPQAPLGGAQPQTPMPQPMTGPQGY